MALTSSSMLPLGSKAPDFELLDPRTGTLKKLHALKSPIGTVIMFICNHCPYVKHILKQLLQLAQDYQSKGINFIAISSNDAELYPEDGPLQMKQIAKKLAFVFPYLYDQTQAIAKAYQATCTPDFYLFDKDLRCVYRGEFDHSRPGTSIPVTGQSLSQALDCLLTGKKINEKQNPSIGCSIKWKT